MEIRDQRIRLEQVSLHYRVAGSDQSRPLVLLHGGGQVATTWARVALAFSDRFVVVAPDQRGHGQSDWPGKYSFELLRDDLAAFVDGLGFKRFSLIGHSMGGTAAYLYAEAHSSRLERLVIEDTPPPGVAFDAGSPADTPSTNHDFRLTKPLLGQLAEPDPAWWERLDQITVPTLLISGGSTSFIAHQGQAAVAARIPDCSLTIIEGAGHEVHEHNPREFIAAVNAFL